MSCVLSIENLLRVSWTGSSLGRPSLMLLLPDVQAEREGPSWMLSGSNACMKRSVWVIQHETNASHSFILTKEYLLSQGWGDKIPEQALDANF